MNSLDQQKVVAIGGTSGIGLATAIGAQKAGATVWAVSRSQDRIDDCRAKYPDINFDQLDTHDVDGLNNLFSSVGEIDHIVAAATGANRTMAPFMEQTDEQFRSVQQILGLHTCGSSRCALSQSRRLADAGQRHPRQKM